MADVFNNPLDEEEDEDILSTPYLDSSDPNTDKEIVEQELGLPDDKVEIPTLDSTSSPTPPSTETSRPYPVGLGARPVSQEIPTQGQVEVEQEKEEEQITVVPSTYDYSPEESVTPVDDIVRLEEKADFVEKIDPALRLDTYSIEVEPGSFTETDLYENDYLYSQIEPYMQDRYGENFVKESSREEVVNRFLNENRSSAVAGNGWSLGSRVMYLSSIDEDQSKLVNAGRAFAVYENMADLTSGKLSGSEVFSLVVDVLRSAVLDPVNLATLGPAGKVVSRPVAKALGATTVRNTNNAIIRAALREQQAVLTRELAAGSARQAAQTAGRDAARSVYRKGIENFERKVAADIANEAAIRRAAISGDFKSLVNRTAIADVAGVVGADALYNVGAEALYQKTLIQTGVQEDYNGAALGLAFLGSLVMGGVVSGGMAARSIRKQNADFASEVIKKGTPDDVLDSVNKSLEEPSQPVRTGTLSEQAKRGRQVNKEMELSQLDPSFFTELVTGKTKKTPTGELSVVSKGLAQSLVENGFRWIKTFEDDTVTAWMSDVIRQSSPAQVRRLIDNLEKNNSIIIKNKGDITPDQFADMFSSSVSDSASLINAMRQTFDSLGIDASNITPEEAIKTKFGMMSEKLSSKIEEQVGERLSDVTRNFQNRMIRLLVSNPGTSYLNALGWAGNTAFASVSDLALSTVHAGVGAVVRIGSKELSDANFSTAAGLLRTNLRRVRYLFNPNLTKKEFDSYSLVAGPEVRKLSEVQSGGIETKNLPEFDSKRTYTEKMTGSYIESAVDFVQRASFVNSIDTFSKTQEFMYQLDRALRQGVKLKGKDGKTVKRVFKGGYSEFIDPSLNPDLKDILFSKSWREVEAAAVDRTLESIFSKSYKGTKGIGEIAAVIEDMRNFPGLGLLVPFGRFFNNTMAFMISATPLGFVGKLMGFYKNRSFGEQFVKAAASAGLVYTLAEHENELRKQGIPIGFGISRTTGEVIDQRYDFPISLFKYAGRIAGYYLEGEEVPENLLVEAGQMFGITGVLRNLTDSQAGVSEIMKGLVSMDGQRLRESFGAAAGAISSQVASSTTRWLEPYNVAVGLAREPKDYFTKDMREGSKVLNQSLRYIDQIVDLFTSKEEPRRVDAAGGAAEVQPSKVLGFRPVSLTYTQRMMGTLGIQDYKLNVAASIADRAPEAVRKYHTLFHRFIEDRSEFYWNQRGFSDWTQDQKERVWKNIVSDARELAKASMQMTNPDDLNLHYQILLLDRFTRSEVRSIMSELFPDKEIEDLTYVDINNIFSYQDFKEVQNSITHW